MVIASPIWLFALLPWSIAAAYLLLGRWRLTSVPFLQLWKIEAPDVTVRSRFSTPPLGLLLALLATLLAILAASQPGVARPGATRIQVVIDTSLTMSARGEQQARFRELTARLSSELQKSGLPDVAIDVHVVPDGEVIRSSGRDLLTALQRTPITAADTQGQADRLAAQLATHSDPVVVISDRPLPLSNAKVVQISPDRSLADVGITHFVIRRSPVPQALVRLHRTPKDSNRARQLLRILVPGTSPVETVVDLPSAGTSRDYFINLPTGPLPHARCELADVSDDIAANNFADVVATRTWPEVVATVPVGELRRLVDLYSSARVPCDRAIRVRIADEAKTLGDDSSGVLLPPITSPTTPTMAGTVVDHPITAGVTSWSNLSLPATPTRTLPNGFTVILSDGVGPLIAVRDQAIALSGGQGVRQVWTAISASGWANRSEYVVLWSAMFDWAGQGSANADVLVAQPVANLSAEWLIRTTQPLEPVAYWPGRYHREPEGLETAFTSGTVPADLTTPPQLSWPAALATLLTQQETIRDGSHWLILASFFSGLGAVWYWRGGRRAT